nr:alpha amylase family protein [uncultured Macellibacteroides sp.]
MKLLILCCLFVCFSCTGTEVEPVVDPDPVDTGEKPKYLWFDAEANFERFSNQDSIRYYLDKTKETGFNHIVVDVRPIYGDVLYKKTSFMTQLTTVNGFSRSLSWDYLQFFIDEAKKRDLKVTVSTTIFPAGRPDTREGLVYRDASWASKTSVQHLSSGMLNVMDDPSKVAAFLNPALPEVQEYALKFIRELVTNYDFDGYALDYCRYLSIESDFSDESRKLFEAYIGEKVINYPNDIFYWEGGQRHNGKYARKWFEFRSKVIHDFVKKAKEEIKLIKPNVQLEYWAASWYGALYAQGQNWASKKYDPSVEYPTWASADYKKTGFAEHLDAFIIGTYLERVYGMDDAESIEYGLAKGKRLLQGDCKMYGSIYALNYANIEDAAYICLMQSDGLMVFDIVQVIQFDLWDELKRAIDKSGY